MSKMQLDKETRYKLQVLAREQLRLRLLADIATDLSICNLEGWDGTEYIESLINELKQIKQKIRSE